MEKVEFFLEDTKETVEFHVLEQTRICLLYTSDAADDRRIV